MAQQTINLGTPNNEDGDFVRTSFSKANDNFTELYARTPVQAIYANMAALYADQGNQLSQFIFEVTDSSAHPSGVVGTAYFKYKGTTVGNDTDYEVVFKLPTGLEAINEGNGIAWRLVGADATQVGAIGLHSLDFTYGGTYGPSATAGPMGNGAVSFGSFSNAPSYQEFSIGTTSQYTPNSTTGNNALDRAFVIGVDGDGIYNIFTVNKSGKVGVGIGVNEEAYLNVLGNIRSVSDTAQIDFPADGKVVPNIDWINAQGFSTTTPSLQAVTDVGNTTTSGIDMIMGEGAELLLRDEFFPTTINTLVNQSSISFSDSQTYANERYLRIKMGGGTNNQIESAGNAAGVSLFSTTLTFPDASQNNSISVPNASGTIALTSDITAASFSEFLTSSGTRVGGDLVTTIGDYDASGNGTRIRISDIAGDINLISPFSTIYLQTPAVGFTETGTTGANFTFSNLTGFRSLLFPDANGTLALTSQITGTNSGTNTGDNAVNTLYSGLEASKQDVISLTTLGTSGAATFVGSTLNIPNYAGGGTGDDVSTFAEKTGALVGTDRLVGLSGATDFSETISGIPLSIFNNDVPYLVSADLSNYVTNALAIKENLSTGYISGLALSINTDNTKFDIAEGYYIITDNTDSLNPVTTVKYYAGSTLNTPSYLATSKASYIALNISGTIIQSSSPFTNTERRSLCTIGAAIHSNNSNINVVNEIKAPIVADTNQLHDLIKVIGSLNESGNTYSANGANLLINRSAGRIWGLGINASNYNNPHSLTTIEDLALTFRYRLRDGTEYADTTLINPTQYDLNGVLTTVSNNKYTIQRINLFQSGITRVQYGQIEYASMNEALLYVQTDEFATEQNIAENAIFRAFLIIKKEVTNLTTAVAADEAHFIPVDKFGHVIGGASVALTYASIIAAFGFTPEDVANKQDSLTPDGTGVKYPTVDAVNAGLDSLSEGLLTDASTITVSRDSALTDADGMNNSTSGTNLTITVLSDANQIIADGVAFDIGTLLQYKRSGAGDVIIAGAGLITTKQTYALDDVLTIRKTATDTWEYLNPAKDITKLDSITVTQAVDLDTMESDIATNNAKVGVTTEEANTINSEPIGSEVQVLQVVSISQANYDLITPVATTFYIING